MSETYAPVMLLQPDDSRRVADALIEMIERTDLAEGLASVLRPPNVTYVGDTGYYPDWFARSVGNMLDNIESGVVDAIERAARRKVP